MILYDVGSQRPLVFLRRSVLKNVEDVLKAVISTQAQVDRLKATGVAADGLTP
jgi:hypothetical protein